MNVLVIGAGGFVGHYLLDALLKTNDNIFATKLASEKINSDGFKIYDLDITDAEAVSSLFEEVRPDCVYHLAAQSSAALSWKKPQLTMNINVIGVLNILETIRALGLKTRLLLVGSGEEYGYVQPENIPIKEDTPVHPANIYAVSKLTQNLVGGLYVKAYDMDIISVRAFNHIGPMQAPAFVASDFSKQVADIEKKLKAPEIHVGNLEAIRDFTDVRDVVRAYILIMSKGIKGKTYNVGGGTVCKISELLNRLLSLSDVKIDVIVDKDKLRPLDAPEISADISLLKADTNWKPEYPLDRTLKEMLDYWRSN